MCRRGDRPKLFFSAGAEPPAGKKSLKKCVGTGKFWAPGPKFARAPWGSPRVLGTLGDPLGANFLVASRSLGAPKDLERSLGVPKDLFEVRRTSKGCERAERATRVDGRSTIYKSYEIRFSKPFAQKKFIFFGPRRLDSASLRALALRAV